MPASITVIVPARTLAHVRSTLVSLDRQDLSPARFDVVAVPLGLDDEDMRTLTRLAQHRPNVQVRPASSLPAVTEAAPPVGGGEYLLLLDEGDGVQETALSRLDAALSKGDLILAPAALTTASPRLRQLLRTDVPDREVLEAIGPQVPLVVDRSLVDDLRPADLEDVLSFRRRAIAKAGSPHVVSGGPAFRLRSIQDDGLVELAPDAATIKAGEARWEEGSILLATTVTIAPEAVVSGVEVGLWLRNLDDGAEYLLPTQTERVDETVAAKAQVDLQAGANGSPIPSGRWCVVVQVETADGLRRRRLDLATAPSTALIAERIVVVDRRKRRLVIDVGAHHTTRLPIDVKEAVITEDGRGTSLHLPLPFASVRPSRDSIPARVRVGEFPLLAELRQADDHAALFCFLSGLEGQYALSFAIGGSRWWSTTADLVIENAGAMRLVDEAQRSDLSPAPKTQASTSPTALGKARGLGGRLLTASRHRVRKALRSRTPAPTSATRRP